LPENVEKLLREHILSVEQLEVLLFLRARADREFDAKGVHDELRTSESSASSRLADLAQRGFLTSRPDGSRTMYRYEPRTEWIKDAVAQLDKAYAERRYTVIERIFSKPIDNLRTFAGAFRFRKDDSDG
jgi:DNA-binding MarR family transcriptional regulator